MKIELIEKANTLHKEIKELKRYKDIQRKKKTTIHFEIVSHFGSPTQYEVIEISRKHNDVFFKVVDTIITELETKLEEL